MRASEPKASAPLDLVDESALEAGLASLRAAAPSPVEGAFGPRSMRWWIDRESVLFLGAGRALLLQLAHPGVAAAVARHSRALDDPIARFHGTFGTVFAIVFGSLDDALGAARRLHHRHAGISGVVRDPVAAGAPYEANERAALRWVHATLVETALLSYGVALPLSDEMRAAYYAESRRMAGFYGLAPDALPPDWDAFETYCRDMAEGPALVVGDEARAIATRLMDGAGSRLRAPRWYRALTAALLPRRVRDAFGLPFGEAEFASAERARARIAKLYPLLPGRLRFVGPYHEAQERIAGRAPSAATRLANRFWIGRPSLAVRS